MTMTAEAATVSLKVHRVYDSSLAQVYHALSDANALGQWFGPHSHKCKVEQYDFREGGEYRIRMIPVAEDSDCGGDSSQDSVCAGTFVKIVQDSEIVMTFDWVENGSELGESLLTFQLQALQDGKTRLQITHEKLPNKEIADMHQGGWEGSLECLQEFLEGK